MSLFDDPPDADDPFASTRMTFGEHLEDLRRHLIRAIVGFLVALAFSFLIGHRVLEFIKAPIQQELEEFYADRARQVLQNPDANPKLREANRPRFIRLSFLPQQLQAAQKGQVPPEAPPQLPRVGEPIPYPDLMARAQFFVATASEALNRGDWEKVSRAADGLVQTADRLPQANQVAEATKTDSPHPVAQLAHEATALLDAASRHDGAAAAGALGRMEELLGERGLVPLWVRLEDPLRFFALFQGALMQVYRRPDLTALSVQEAFIAFVKVSMVCALVTGSPWIFWQIWLFVAAGLYRHEKRLVNVYLPVSVGLFITGVLLCEFLVIPKAIRALLWFNHWLQLEPEFRFSEWLGFAIWMPVLFGAAFQLPLFMMFLDRVGILSAETYRKRWRMACLIIHVFAAIVVPSPDALSMECLALPMFGLYLLGIALCRLNPREQDTGAPRPDELVGV